MGGIPPAALGIHELVTMNATTAIEPRREIFRRKGGAMRFGSMRIALLEGRVTQVGATEKMRLADEPRRAESQDDEH